MTEQEKEIDRVIKYIRSCRNAGIDTTITIDKSRNHLILNALEELQQYRTIGTVKEFQEYKKIKGNSKKAVLLSEEAHSLFEQYMSIGTVTECREDMEKQRAKKPVDGKMRKVLGYYQCPVCGGLLTTGKHFCEDCGQAISWETED